MLPGGGYGGDTGWDPGNGGPCGLMGNNFDPVGCFAPIPTPPQPRPDLDELECQYVGTTIQPPQWGNGDVGYGYYLPVALNFTVNGGQAPYLWSATQRYSAEKWALLSDGTQMSGLRLDTEELTTGSLGMIASFFDAPGVALSQWGQTIVSAFATWRFVVSVSVSSRDGQSVTCEDVSWSAWEVWIPLPWEQKPHVSGGVIVP